MGHYTSHEPGELIAIVALEALLQSTSKEGFSWTSTHRWPNYS